MLSEWSSQRSKPSPILHSTFSRSVLGNSSPVALKSIAASLLQQWGPLRTRVLPESAATQIAQPPGEPHKERD